MHIEQRTPHGVLVLHGGPSPLLVPMDVAQRLLDIVVGNATGT